MCGIKIGRSSTYNSYDMRIWDESRWTYMIARFPYYIMKWHYINDQLIIKIKECVIISRAITKNT